MRRRQTERTRSARGSNASVRRSSASLRASTANCRSEVAFLDPQSAVGFNGNVGIDYAAHMGVQPGGHQLCDGDCPQNHRERTVRAGKRNAARKLRKPNMVSELGKPAAWLLGFDFFCRGKTTCHELGCRKRLQSHRSGAVRCALMGHRDMATATCLTDR